MKKEKKALKAIKMVSATTSTIETKGRQDGQLAYVPALDKHGNPAFIAVETTMPDKPLQLGTSRKDTVKLEANLVKHIAALKWKEPKKKNMIVCAHCGKSVVREHATQKYCDACQKIVKKEKGKLRQRKSRQAKKNNVTEPYRGSAGEIILYVTRNII